MPDIAQAVLRATGTRLHTQVVGNSLCAAGLPARRPLQTIPHICQRWRKTQWRQVLLTDEFRFCLLFADGRSHHARLSRPCGNAFRSQASLNVTVMVWRWIHWDDQTDLIVQNNIQNAHRYCGQVITPVVTPSSSRTTRTLTHIV